MGRARVKGVPLSPGIAIGRLQLAPDALVRERRSITEEEIQKETEKLVKACDAARRNLEARASSIPAQLTEYDEIMAAQLELTKDPRIVTSASARIKHKKICASWALSDTIAELCELFRDIGDPYLSSRADDIRAVGRAIMLCLSGKDNRQSGPFEGIIGAYEISPGDLLEADPRNVKGLLTVAGAPTSHIAILARGLKIPAVSGLTNLFTKARNGETVIVDGLRGAAIFGPDEADLAYYKALLTKYSSFETEAQKAADTAARTRDGVVVSTFANLDRPEEISTLAGSGAEGIGLYRTELSYLGHKLPDEASLLREYEYILKGADKKRVVFRTLDAGSDKIISQPPEIREPNPALGMRGIRFCLDHEPIFCTQLRALLQTASSGNAAIMLPMITSLSELRKVKDILSQIRRQLYHENLPCPESIELGIMIETPAAVFICQELARECDFLSIGTNDLLHYLMAIDRNNNRVAYLHDPLHPAFLRAIKQVADAGRQQGKQVCVCGELASDPLGLALLLGLGITSISAIPRFIPLLKHLLRKLDSRQCAKIANRALEGDDPEMTRRHLKNVLDESLVSDLLFPTHPISTSQSS